MNREKEERASKACASEQERPRAGERRGGFAREADKEGCTGCRLLKLLCFCVSQAVAECGMWRRSEENVTFLCVR